MAAKASLLNLGFLGMANLHQITVFYLGVDCFISLTTESG
jgi:hypothetical protein